MPKKSTIRLIQSRYLVLIRPKLTLGSLLIHGFILVSSVAMIVWIFDAVNMPWYGKAFVMLIASFNFVHFFALLLRNITIALPSRIVTMYNPFYHSFPLSDIKELAEIEYSDSESSTYRLEFVLETGKRIRLETVSPNQTKELKAAIERYLYPPNPFDE